MVWINTNRNNRRSIRGRGISRNRRRSNFTALGFSQFPRRRRNVVFRSNNTNFANNVNPFQPNNNLSYNRIARRRPRGRGNNNGNSVLTNNFRSTPVSIPLGLGANVENRQKSTVRLTRVGYASGVQGSKEFSTNVLIMHPSRLPWIKTLCNAWDKYKFINFSVRYVGQSGSTRTGSAYIGFDFDPHDDPAPNLWSAQSYDKFTMCPLWSTSSWITVPTNILADKWYDVEENFDKGQPDSWHDKIPGRVIFGSVNAGEPSRNLMFVGQIEIAYTVTFSRPTAMNEQPPASTFSIPGRPIGGSEVDESESFSDVDEVIDSFKELSV